MTVNPKPDPQTPQHDEKDHGGTSLTGVDNVSVLVPAPELGAKRLRVFGPADNPDEPNCYMGEAEGDLSALIERLKDYLPNMQPDERFVIRVKPMTDAEVEALPDV